MNSQMVYFEVLLLNYTLTKYLGYNEITIILLAKFAYRLNALSIIRCLHVFIYPRIFI